MIKTRPLKDKPKLKRQVIHFCCPNQWNPADCYHIGFCYYREDYHPSIHSGPEFCEEVHLTENELYEILKPHLIKTINP